MRAMRLVTTLVFVIISSVNIYSQSSKPKQGFFPEAQFNGEFGKFGKPENDFSHLVSWNSKMGFKAKIIQIGRSGLSFKSEFQTIGAKNLGQKINIAGTSYILEGSYSYDLSDYTTVSVNITHLSNHFAADFARVIQDEKRLGRVVPKVDTSDLNVFSVEVDRRFKSRFEPEIHVRIQPVGFRFRGDTSRYNKPVYIMAQAVIWEGHEKRIVPAIQKEFGKSGWTEYSVRFELAAHNQREGRFQPFISYTPGGNLQVSTNDGWHRSGFMAGFKLRFHAN